MRWWDYWLKDKPGSAAELRYTSSTGGVKLTAKCPVQPTYRSNQIKNGELYERCYFVVSQDQLKEFMTFSGGSFRLNNIPYRLSEPDKDMTMIYATLKKLSVNL